MSYKERHARMSKFVQLLDWVGSCGVKMIVSNMSCPSLKRIEVLNVVVVAAVLVA